MILMISNIHNGFRKIIAFSRLAKNPPARMACFGTYRSGYKAGITLPVGRTDGMEHGFVPIPSCTQPIMSPMISPKV